MKETDEKNTVLQQISMEKTMEGSLKDPMENSGVYVMTFAFRFPKCNFAIEHSTMVQKERIFPQQVLRTIFKVSFMTSVVCKGTSLFF